MNEILTKSEINQFKKDGAIFIKGKFDINWIEKLKKELKEILKIQVLDLNLIHKKKMFQDIRGLLDMGFSPEI